MLKMVLGWFQDSKDGSRIVRTVQGRLEWFQASCRMVRIVP